MSGPVKTRTYDNARRAAAARRTEQRVVETAQRLLLERGARVTDRDSGGKTVQQAATSDWTRALLRDATAG